MSRRRWRLKFAGLAVLALAVRVGFVLLTPRYSFLSRVGGIRPYDPAEYDAIARSLIGGTGFRGGLPPVQAYRPPGYPFFLAAVYSVVGTGGGRVEAVRLVQAVLGTVSVGLLGLLARRLLGARAALVAMALAAVYVPALLVGGAFVSEALFVALLLGGLLCALHARTGERPLGWAASAGVLAGLAALTRGNGLVLLPVLGLLVWSASRRGRRSLVAPALLVACAVLTIAPWAIRNAAVLGRFVPVSAETGFTLAGTYNDVVQTGPWGTRGRWLPPWRIPAANAELERWVHGRISGLEVEDRLRRHALGFIARRPQTVPVTMLYNSARLADLVPSETRYTLRGIAWPAAWTGVEAASFWLVGALALLGVRTLRGRGVPRSLWLVPLALWLTTVPFASGTPRFRAPLEPFVLLLAAAAVDAALARAGPPPPPAALTATVTDDPGHSTSRSTADARGTGASARS